MAQPEEPFENVAYLYDGTLEGLLSAVFASYERKETPADIVTERIYQARLEQSWIAVQTDFCRADRVRAGIVRKAGHNAFVAVMRASTCDDYDMGSIVLQFVQYAMSRDERRRTMPILNELSRKEVHDLLRLSNYAVNECEKMRQFIRFSHLENGVWFARCNPNASVVPLIMGHFAARMGDQPFIIYDENHHLAGVFDGTDWQLVAQDAVEPCNQTAHDALMEQAWKRFYDALAVDARYNPELRRHFMPVRLWANLGRLNF